MQNESEHTEARSYRLCYFLNSLLSGKLLAFHGAQDIRGPWHFLGSALEQPVHRGCLSTPRQFAGLVQIVFNTLLKNPEDDVVQQV